MVSSSSSTGFHLLNGVIVAFSGSNRERRGEAIKNGIGGLISVLLLAFGVALAKVTFPWGSSLGQQLLAGLSQAANTLFGVILLIVGGLGSLVSLVVLLCLLFGSLRQNRREKEPGYVPDPNNKSAILKKEDIPAKTPLILSAVLLGILVVLLLIVVL